MTNNETTMRTKPGYIILGIVAVLGCAVGAWVGENVAFAQQIELLRELREVSTIIFGIVGAWAAIVYPGELKQKLRPTEVTTLDPDQLANFRSLMRCLIFSALVVVAVLLIQYVGVALRPTQLVQQYSGWLRRIYFGMTCLLGVAQLWVILLMLIPINSADADVRLAQETQEHLMTGPQGRQGKRSK